MFSIKECLQHFHSISTRFRTCNDVWSLQVRKTSRNVSWKLIRSRAVASVLPFSWTFWHRWFSDCARCATRLSLEIGWKCLFKGISNFAYLQSCRSWLPVVFQTGSHESQFAFLTFNKERQDDQHIGFQVSLSIPENQCINYFASYRFFFKEVKSISDFLNNPWRSRNASVTGSSDTSRCKVWRAARIPYNFFFISERSFPVTCGANPR